MATEIADEDIRMAVGLAGSTMAMELVAMLWSKNMLSDNDVLTMIGSGIQSLEHFRQAQPHLAWKAAQDLLRIQATGFDRPRPGTKPS